jgi:hypothetical protein
MRGLDPRIHPVATTLDRRIAALRAGPAMTAGGIASKPVRGNDHGCRAGQNAFGSPACRRMALAV